MNYYVHHTPGRLRVRIPLLRNNHRKVETVKTLLTVPGTETIKANALTGSVVVTFDQDALAPQELLDLLKDNGFYSEDRAITLDKKLHHTSKRAARKVSRAMFGWAVGKVLEAKGLSLIAAFI